MIILFNLPNTNISGKHLRLFLFFFISISLRIYAQISPGDLTNAHSDLEGMSSCTKCHEIGERVKNSKCLFCHTEVNDLIKSGKGYHSHSDVVGKNCSECHSEHHGRDFRIVNFNSKNFIHTKTSFPLTGSHTKVKCTECHNSKNIKNLEAFEKKAEWMGLSSVCSSCHQDYHQGTLGTNCNKCHNTEKFRPSLFNHEDAKFKLTGSHLKTDCSKCHKIEKRQGREFQKFKGILFSSCENCHRDIHSGKFGKDCRKCHNTNSFQSVDKQVFDHNKTGFVLIGKHQTVNCNSCHKNNFTEKLKHEKCIDCHTDFHNGEFAAGGIVKNCNECHSENGFSPSLYTLAQHNVSVFPLTGSHLAASCANCHLKENKWKFRNIGAACNDCHRDVHQGEINEKFYLINGCSNCHLTDGWNIITFDHNKTEFPLAGKHREIKCRNCHFAGNDAGRQRFKSLNGYCTECHEDIHVNQFGSGKSEECSRCHSSYNWKPEKFDHNKTKFTLEGAHSKLQCSECHKKIMTGDKTFIKYKLENFQCASCHS